MIIDPENISYVVRTSWKVYRFEARFLGDMDPKKDLKRFPFGWWIRHSAQLEPFESELVLSILG